VPLGEVELLVNHDDGVCIARLEIGPGGTATGVTPIPGASYYYIVVDGAICADGRDNPALSHVFVSLGGNGTLVPGCR
jgi:hypothetical protein